MDDTPALLVYTNYRLVPDDVEAFRSLATRLTAMSMARDGCIFLDIAQDISDATTFRLIEGWRDQESLDAHGASEDFRAVLEDAAALGIVSRTVDIYSVSERSTVDIPASAQTPREANNP